jgi:D-alanine-D-alanine ligase
MTWAADGKRMRVVVLFGGRSGEHEVSVASARSVVANLDPAKYDVSLVGITKDGQWLRAGEGGTALPAGPTVSEGAPAILPADHGRATVLQRTAAGLTADAKVDVVFPVLHGPYGEDGTVQGLLELAGLPYVGAGVLGSAVGMDKAVMKTLLRAAGLPVTDWVVLQRREWQADRDACVRRVAESPGFPCFVKPANMGSSVGISRADNAEELGGAVDLAAQFDLKVLVESAVPNPREIECAVLGNDAPEASVLGEVIPSRDFYSYEAKYVDDDSALIIPADLPGELAESVRGMALEAFRTLDCAGMGRVDFLVRKDTGEVFVNEINTLPGFTTISMYPKLWQASGLSYGALLDRLIGLALERHAERASLRTSYT